jgi:protein TonB
VLRRAPAPRLGGAIGASLVLHAVAAATLVFVGTSSRPPALPPMYRVNLVAAPPGPRQIGQVTPAREAPPEQPTPPPARAETRPRDMPAPPTTKQPPQRRSTAATPTTSTKSVPRDAPARRAGGGETGGRGTDVANVRTEGIEFPYPGYLDNIVRQIALNFKPDRGSALRAVIFFMIHRDGSVSGIRYMTRSGSLEFDLEARGAIEAAAQARAFGPLPDGFGEPVLPVIFSFDPTLIR